MEPFGRGDALVVIDVQRKYSSGVGPLAVADGPSLVERLAGFARTARARGVPVIWVTREALPGRSMGAATDAAFDASLFHGDAAALDDGLGAMPSDIFVVKPRQSAFYGTDLEVVLRAHGVRRVVLTGVTTNICVQATAQDARARDLAVVVVADLTACLPVTAPGHEHSAEAMQAATLATLAHAVATVCSSSALE
jgi:nicotinamidase-related amidase